MIPFIILICKEQEVKTKNNHAFRCKEKKAQKEFLCLLNVKNEDVEFLTCIVKFKYFILQIRLIFYCQIEIDKIF